MNTTRDIYLNGALGELFGSHHRLAVASPAEAVRALSVVCKGFKKYLMESGDHGVEFHVFVGDDNITEDELLNPAGQDSITFTPVLRGAKSGVLAAIAGVALIVVGSVMLFTGVGTAFAPYVIGLGVGLLGVGMASMMAPNPEREGEEDQRRSNASFSGPVNTQAQGGPVAYYAGGPGFIGSAVVSAAISVTDGVTAPLETPTSGGGGGSKWAELWREAMAQEEE